jgi:hypothetical protein
LFEISTNTSSHSIQNNTVDIATPPPLPCIAVKVCLGQTLTKLKKTQGGLLSFNNFLSTNKNRDVSLKFARRTISTSDLAGILFIMKIDPSIPLTPFASIHDVSAYQTEEEILFSMHSVFRIEQMKEIDRNDRLWQMDLLLTVTMIQIFEL